MVMVYGPPAGIGGRVNVNSPEASARTYIGRAQAMTGVGEMVRVILSPMEAHPHSTPDLVR